MTKLDKIQATCKHCEKNFVLQMIVVSAAALKSGEFPIRGVQFACPHCRKFNTFSKEDISVVD